MRVIHPIAVTAANLAASNVLEDDAAAWTAGTYNADDEVIFDYRLYRALDTTTDQPDVGAAAAVPTWLDLGAINRYRMFDEIVGTQTTRAGTIDVTVAPGQIANGVALFNVSALTVQVQVIDPVDGVVYDQTLSMDDATIVADWYAYFFEPVSLRADIAFVDLPNYASAQIRIVIDAGAGTAAVGAAVVGRQRSLGLTEFSTSVGIDDYSRKERDSFGNFRVVERSFSKWADFDVEVDTPAAAAVQRALSQIRATPTVFIGTQDREESVVYGFYRNFRIVIPNPVISKCSIEVEGLV